MLTKILEFHHSSFNFIQETFPTLYLGKDTYEDYLAFLFQNNEEMTSDNHILYLQKAAFDCVLQSFHDQDLLLLQQKQDMYMHYIMHSTFKNCGLISQQEFVETISEMSQFYLPTSEELLFIEKIQKIIKSSLINQTSPFTYLQVCKDLFTQKLLLKLTDILKFMIGDAICYKMLPASIFGICLKWTVDKYGIKNVTIKQLIEHLINVNDSETCEKIDKLAQIMNQIMNMKPIQ